MRNTAAEAAAPELANLEIIFDCGMYNYRMNGQSMLNDSTALYALLH